MANSVGQIALDLGINYGGFSKELNGIAGKASGMVGSAFTKLGGIIAGAFATAKLFEFGKGAIELASNLQEVQNVVDVTFGGMSAEVNNWSKNMIESFGLSELSAKKYSSTMGAMLKSTGIAGVQMKDMSKQLTELAADMSSFYNLGNDEAFYKVFAGMTGETEPLKALGVNLSVANMEAFALSRGIQKSYEKMTQAEQTLLRYNYLLSVTKDAQGDFARTSDSWANQTRILSEQWKIFKGTIGAGLINALTPTISWINTLIAKLQVAAQYFKAFTALLFGNASAVETSTAKAAASTAAMGVATEDAGKAAQKAAKATKGSLSAFDQLNVLSQSTADAMGDAASSALAAGSVDLGQAQSGTVDIGVEIDTSKLSGLKDLLEPLSRISLAPLKTSLDGLKESLTPFTENIGAGLKWLYHEVLVPLATWTVESAIPAFLDVLAGTFNVLNAVIETFKPAASWLWENFLKPVAVWTGGVIVDVLKGLANGLERVSDWITNNQGLVLDITIAMGAFFAAFKIAEFLIAIAPFISTLGSMLVSGELLAGVLTGISAAFTAITSPVVIVAALLGALIFSFIDLYRESSTFRQDIVQLGQTWKTALKPLADFVGTVLKDAWEKILKPAVKFFVDELIPDLLNIFKKLWQDVLVPFANFIGTALQPAFKVLSDILTMLWKNIVLPLADAVGEVLKAAWQGLYDILTKTVIPIVNKVIEVVTYLWKNVINPIINVLWDNLKPAFDTVFSGIGDIIGDFKDILVGVINFITGVFTGDWERAWNGVKDIFGGIFNTLYDLVKIPLNLIIEGVNKVIRGLNKISFSIPDVPGIPYGGTTFGISIPEITPLAKGGLAYGPTLAMVGDNKGAGSDPEVVAPLSKLTGMLETSNQGVVEVLFMILDVLQNFDPSIDLDGERLGSWMRNKLRAEDSRIGRSAVTVGGVSIR